MWQVAYAATHRLHDFARGKTFRPKFMFYGSVHWDLYFVYENVRVIQSLLRHPQAHSGYNWFSTIAPLVVHGFRSIPAILENLDLQSPGRNRKSEKKKCCLIYIHLTDIYRGPQGNTLISLDFLQSLMDRFSSLTGVEDWRNMHFEDDPPSWYSRFVMALESTLLPVAATPERLGESPTSHAEIDQVEYPYLLMMLSH